jgi:hypothetical protein
MNYKAATLLLALLLLPSSSPFIPSHPSTTLRINNAAFQFYASDANESNSKQRKIRINIDQQVSVRRAATPGENWADNLSNSDDTNG